MGNEAPLSPCLLLPKGKGKLSEAGRLCIFSDVISTGDENPRKALLLSELVENLRDSKNDLKCGGVLDHHIVQVQTTIIVHSTCQYLNMNE